LDDTLNGVVSTAETTLNVSDSIDGGAGTDTLSVVVGASAGPVALNGSTITGVENFIVRNVSGQTVSQDFALITGETGFTSNVSTNIVTVTNLAAGTTATIVGNGAATNSDTNIGYIATTATAGALVINSGVTAGDVIVTGTALKSQSVSSTGATNVIGALTLAATTTALTIDAATKLTTGTITGAALTSVTVTGAGAVDIDFAALPATVTSVLASASTGAVSVNAGNVAADTTNPSTVDIADVTISTGTGNDVVNVSNVDTARELSVSTGAGDDTITIGTVLVDSGTTIAGDVIAAGEGIDTLKMATAVATAQTAVTTVSGIDKIAVSDALAGTLTNANFQAGIATVDLLAGANAGTIVFGAGSNVVNLGAALAGQLTINDTGSATTDSVTINNTATTAVNMGGAGAQALVVGGFETVNIVTTGAGAATTQTFGAITVTADTGGSSTVNFSGGNSVSAAIITAQSVSASGLTGTKSLTMTAAMVGKALGVSTLTGSAGADTLVGDADDTTNITGGAGNDTITGGSDFETIDGGDGDDTIAGGGGADTLNGGGGADQITLGSTTASANGGDGDDLVTASTNLTFGTTVIGGAGVDTLSVSFATAVSAANGSVVSGFETLLVSATGNTVALANFGNNTFSTVQVGALAATTITGVGSQTINLTGVIAGDLTVTLASATGTSDSATVAVTSLGATTQTAAGEVVLAGVETVNLTMVDLDTTAHVNTLGLNADSATTINVSGNAGLVIGAEAGTDIADVTTFNASGVVLGAVTDVGVTYAATYNAVGGVSTITGSNGVDNLTGGAITNDTISGGSGVDTIVYTGGADTFTGGAGNDIFDVNLISAGTTTSKLVITDLTKSDTINVADIDAGLGVASAALGAKGSLGSAATFQNYLDNAAAGNATTAGAAGAAAAIAKWFQFDGNTFLVIDNSAATTFAAGDSVIQFNGLIDLSTSTFAASVLTIV
jgi:S-layer protein